MYTDDQLLERKPENVYSRPVKRQISMISFNKDKMKLHEPTIFGSFIYRTQKYAGDIDLIEDFEYEDRESTIKLFIARLRQIINGLKGNRFFSEFKCGNDKRYDIDIGALSNGKYYIADDFAKNITIMENQGLITNDEYFTMLRILRYLPEMRQEEQINSYDFIYYFFRQKKNFKMDKSRNK